MKSGQQRLILSVGKLSEAVPKFCEENQTDALRACRAEVTWYCLHMHAFMRYLVKNGRVIDFCNALAKKLESEELGAEVHSACFAVLGASSASGAYLNALRWNEKVEADCMKGLDLFLSPFSLAEDARAGLAGFVTNFLAALREYQRTGFVKEGERLEAFRTYLGCAFLLTDFAVKEKFISAIDECYVMNYGLCEPKQARYVADFLRLTTETVAA